MILNALSSAASSAFAKVSSTVSQATQSASSTVQQAAQTVSNAASGTALADAYSTAKSASQMFRSTMTHQVGAAAGAAAATQLDPSDPAQRQKLISGSPQTNPVADKAGNSGSICSGAAMLNAMLLDCKDSKDTERNAKALRDAADKHGAWSQLPDKVDASKVRKALDNMQDGKLSPTDAQHLQQLTYALGKCAQKQGAGEGLSAGGMGAAVTLLRAEGAFKNTTPTFHLATLPNGTGHWTVSSEGQHANSMPANGKSGPAQLGPGLPPECVPSPTNQRWQGQVQVGLPRVDEQGKPVHPVTVTWRQPPGGTLDPTGPGEAWTVDLNAIDYKAAELWNGIYRRDALVAQLSNPKHKARLGTTTVN